MDRALRISVDLKKLEPMLLTLCPRCAAQFYNSASHHIKKAQVHLEGKPFRVLKIGNQYRILKKSFDDWMCGVE